MAIVFKHRYKSGSLIGTGAVKFRPYTAASPLPQLATPQNVTANGTTVSWDEVENATRYALLADGSEIGTVEGAVTDELAGTWVFNNTLSESITSSVNFISNNETFTSINCNTVGMPTDHYCDYDETRVYQYVHGSGIVWADEAYKTITITSKLSEVTDGDMLLTWLRANATKQ